MFARNVDIGEVLSAATIIDRESNKRWHHICHKRLSYRPEDRPPEEIINPPGMAEEGVAPYTQIECKLDCFAHAVLRCEQYRVITWFESAPRNEMSTVN